MNERIKKLRRYLGLTQKEFGQRIGVKANTIATYEGGRNKPIDSVVTLICREFCVSEKWLRTGKGDMLVPVDRSLFGELSSRYGLSRREYILIEKLLVLSPNVRQGIINYIVDVAAALSAEDTPAPDATSKSEMTAEDQFR